MNYDAEFSILMQAFDFGAVSSDFTYKSEAAEKETKLIKRSSEK